MIYKKEQWRSNRGAMGISAKAVQECLRSSGSDASAKCSAKALDEQ
jgi:hypothetical protein